MASSIFAPLQQILTSGGTLGVGLKVFVYQAGTTTKLNTYPTAADADAGTNANTNPIVLNARGEPTSGGAWLADAVRSYKLVLALAADSDPPSSPIRTQDHLAAITTRASNYAATTAPGATDDSDAGYSVGSKWVDVTADTAYLCVDATVGAAVWDQISNLPAILNNYSATSAPTADDDTADGYSVGSEWVNVTTDISYVCVDASAGAAVWYQTSIDATVVRTTGGQSVGGVKAFTDVATVVDANGGAAFSVGYRDIPQNEQDAAYEFALSDRGKSVGKASTDARAYTVHPNTTVAFPLGTAITVYNHAASGNITLTQGDGVTLRLAGSSTTGNRTLGAYGVCTLLKVDTDVWLVSGAGVT